jgi:hypothetical protein
MRPFEKQQAAIPSANSDGQMLKLLLKYFVMKKGSTDFYSIRQWNEKITQYQEYE